MWYIFYLCVRFIYCVTTWLLLMSHVKDLIAISSFLFLTNYLQCIIGQKVKGTCLLFVRNGSNVIFRPSHYLYLLKYFYLEQWIHLALIVRINIFVNCVNKMQLFIYPDIFNKIQYYNNLIVFIFRYFL